MVLGEYYMFNTLRIKELRVKNNLTQSDMANILGTGRSSYAMWESNNNIIPLKRLIILADYFHVNLDYLFGFTNVIKMVSRDYDINLCALRLKEFRKGNKLTQNKIANILHIDQPTWSIYENGKSLIGTPFLYDICKKYNLSADYLLGKIDNPKYIHI